MSRLHLPQHVSCDPAAAAGPHIQNGGPQGAALQGIKLHTSSREVAAWPSSCDRMPSTQLIYDGLPSQIPRQAVVMTQLPYRVLNAAAFQTCCAARCPAKQLRCTGCLSGSFPSRRMQSAVAKASDSCPGRNTQISFRGRCVHTSITGQADNSILRGRRHRGHQRLCSHLIALHVIMVFVCWAPT